MKSSLEKERKKMLKEALEMSNNYKVRRAELTDLVLKNEELDDELGFLDEQILVAQENNRRLREELQSLKDEMTRVDPNFRISEEDNLFEILTSLSPRTAKTKIFPADKIPLLVASPEVGGSRKESLRVVKSLDNFSGKYGAVPPKVDSTSPFLNMPPTQIQDNVRKLRDMNGKLQELVAEVESIPMHEFEVIFRECVANVRAQSRKRAEASGRDMLNSSSTRGGEDDLGSFNDFEKRQIIQEYLTNERVKKMIYDRLFSELSLIHI
eukprot:TRINITY_DN12581_c0_g1_i2.p1 TRINITY_DN12581_c0_g1~~TRINITY_DN12581_c0_g1_i2.p1  ORF type:complete len:267 (-),score=65.04 TRINITY_DN12581_c0_g1_i2:60-860(-)